MSERPLASLGLRGRLLLSFIAISGFAVVAAVVGNYAFYAIGEALHQVTERSVPPAIATLELAQRTERIVAGGPTLLSATTEVEFKAASSVLDDDLKEATRALSELPGQGLTAAELSEIRSVFEKMTTNLDALKTAAQGRIAAADRKAALVRDTFDAYSQFRAIWTPRFQDVRNLIVTLQRTLQSTSSSPEERLAAFERLNTAIRDLAPLEQIQQEAAAAFETLLRASGASTTAALETFRIQADQSVRRIDNLVSGLDIDVSLALIAPLSRMRNNAVGSSSIIAARQAELAATQEGRRLTVEHADVNCAEQRGKRAGFRLQAWNRGSRRANARGPAGRQRRLACSGRAQPDQLGPHCVAVCRPQCRRAN